MIFARDYLKSLYSSQAEKHIRQIEKLQKNEIDYFARTHEFPKSVSEVREQLKIDKDERILTLYTFAALNKCNPPWYKLLNEYLNVTDFDCIGAKLKLEKAIPKSWNISNSLKKYASQNNIRYVSEISKHDKHIEGYTRFDAILLEKKKMGKAIFFECKFTSDISIETDHCDNRNQIARCIDVGLESLDNDISRFYFVFVTPQRYKGRKSRLYDFKMEQYMHEPQALADDIPRISGWSKEKLVEISKRISWITWEDCFKILEHCGNLGVYEKQAMQEFYRQRRLVIGEGMDADTGSDVEFHKEIFDGDFERNMNKKMNEIIRKHRGYPSSD